MEDEDKELIAAHAGYCGTCKHYKAALCKPTESTNKWESWFNFENAECRRYPPVFVGGNESCETEDGEFDALNWQHPKVHAFCECCGEYARATWLPNVICTP
jgi:hypothetical protein